MPCILNNPYKIEGYELYQILLQLMDEEGNIEFFGPDEEKPNFEINGLDSPVREKEQPRPEHYPKAYNPYDAIRNLPPEKQSSYSHMFLNYKAFTGLTHFFQIDKEGYQDEGFMENIQQSVFQSNWYENALGIKDLFEDEGHGSAEEYTKQIHELKEKVDSIYNNTFNSVSINKTVSQPFYDHLQNFLYLNAEVSFVRDFEQSWAPFIQDIKNTTGPGPQLLIKIYGFWMKGFKNFVQEIWKYSQKFTLSFLKKNKDMERESQSSGFYSNASQKMRENEKRRPWKNSELQILYKIVESNGAYTQANLNRIASQLNRSPASISSKIQKIIKSKKRLINPDFEQTDNMTLTDKIIEILKVYPSGLSRQNVIERINQNYQMGFDESWMKSVAQILSSKTDFVKFKGVFQLIGHHQFDMNKKAFKDKVINCLLKCPGQQADLKKIVQVYVGLYEKVEGISILSQQRQKAIETSISKSLCRYDIFDKSKSKTVYRLKEFCESKDLEMDIQSFLN